MAASEQVGHGWLVIGGQGRVVFSKGRIPDGMIVEDGALSEAVLQLSNDDGSSTLLDLLGANGRSGGEFANSGCVANEARFTWNDCHLTAVAAGGTVGLLIEHPPVEEVSSRKSADTFETSHVGMYRMSLDGFYLQVNPTLASLYGYHSAGDLLEAPGKVTSPRYIDSNRAVEFLEIMRSQGDVRDFQSEVGRPDGSVVWVTEYARPVLDEHGGVKYYEGTVFDISHHKAAERELRASRDRFMRLVESVSVVPWEVEALTGRVRYVGPQAEHLLAFPVGDWFNPGFWSERIHPMDRDWVEIVREDAIRNLGRFESEYRLVNARDEIVWVRDIVSVIDAEDGERILGGFLQDITHRRSAEAALRRNQDFIEQIANASPLIWYVLEVNTGKPVYINGGGTGILGFSKASLLKMERPFFLEIGHPDEIEDHHAYFQQLGTIRKEECRNREFRLRTADGNWVWVRTQEAALHVTNDGRVLQVVGTAEDITIRKAALEELAKSEALFRRLAETTNVIPFEFDLSALQFTYIGPQAEVLFGFRPEEWLEEDFWRRLVHAEDRPHVEENFRELVANGKAHVELELRLRDSRGDYRWVRQIIRSESDGEHRLIGRGFLLDISVSKLLEVEREESRNRLRELALQNQRAREEERVAMSRELHDELGQALTLLRIDLTWVASRIGRSDDDAMAASLKQKIGEMEGDIGKTLQTLRRITTQLRPPVLDELGLADAIDWQVKDFSRRVGIRCDVTAEPVNCGCKTIATVTFRTLQELLTNVARHSRASRVRVLLKEIAGALTLTVSDNGCGFDLAALKSNEGLGLLGLRERAESLEGTLRIESRCGSGTTVTLNVPAHASACIDGQN